MRYYIVDKQTGKALVYYTKLDKAVAMKTMLPGNGTRFYVYHAQNEEVLKYG